MGHQDTITACALVIGNEVLSGRTRDANLNWLASRCTEMGIRLAEARVIPDVEDVIVDAINDCRAKYTYVFTTGGIGPTHDDKRASRYGILMSHKPMNGVNGGPRQGPLGPSGHNPRLQASAGSQEVLKQGYKGDIGGRHRKFTEAQRAHPSKLLAFLWAGRAVPHPADE